MNKFLVMMIVLAVGLFGFLIWNKKSNEVPQDEKGQLSNHVQGKGTGKVTIVEYGDLECPACGAYYPTLNQVKEFYGDKIKFQYKHFPLVSIHKKALSAHKAAEAAGMQGKFWEMHDLIYERQQTWTQANDTTKIFEEYAKELSLDLEKFKTDRDSRKVNSTIQADLKESQSLGNTSTPTIYINGEKIDPLRNDFSFFKQLIDAELAKQSS